MKDCYLKARAYVDWLELKEELEGLERNYSIWRLCSVNKGFNLNEDDKMFDMDFKSTTCTVIEEEPGRFTLTDSVEVWDVDGTTALLCSVKELKKYIVED